MKRILVDTNVFIGFMNAGLHDDVMAGYGFVRYLSAVVLMELEAGATTAGARRAVDRIAAAYGKTGRVVSPSAGAFRRAGRLLQRLRRDGREVRRSSLVNDLLIALTGRDIGATVVTADASDYRAIAEHLDFDYALI